MAIMVIIDEHHPHRSPERESEAWQMLCHETSVRSYSSFFSLEDDHDAEPSLDRPIVIAGHTWYHIASVRFHVWVRGDEPINVDVDDNELLARDVRLGRSPITGTNYGISCPREAPIPSIIRISDFTVTLTLQLEINYCQIFVIGTPMHSAEASLHSIVPHVSIRTVADHVEAR
ncbi:uncharacterized protein EDB91DRAFT_1159381 [Suillus paluster]|uniref:uncharacterized protein n=1 Tax=Suillus paluster TaxID=48578 RepID=UPI001B86AD15|nr:uncharacterized protein EDB91DRAFT_1159381 [Suillus paluster]KAG1729499.1 hypothetical protein EDB91DRAFT_1159381 [Suillus paluster]